MCYCRLGEIDRIPMRYLRLLVYLRFSNPPVVHTQPHEMAARDTQHDTYGPTQISMDVSLNCAEARRDSSDLRDEF